MMQLQQVMLQATLVTTAAAAGDNNRRGRSLLLQQLTCEILDDQSFVVDCWSNCCMALHGKSAADEQMASSNWCDCC
jgi:hypothetical protein